MPASRSVQADRAGVCQRGFAILKHYTLSVLEPFFTLRPPQRSEARVLGYSLSTRQTTFIGWRSGEILAAGKCIILARGDGVARRRGTAKSEIHFGSGDTPDQDIAGQRRADGRVKDKRPQ
ncbi:hypothetical protein DFH09DRAFT_1281044 [Mycena vulgaris]|nr:hypothetical protein DFH09DRAFT_1281044 [Mycena vulgaris]